MNKKLKDFIVKYSEDSLYMNKIIVSQFLRCNNFTLSNECYLSKYQIDDIAADIVSIEQIEDVIEIFELAIPKEEKIENGAVYTPKFIRDSIIERVFDMGRKIPKESSEWICADISCGCGAFIYTLALELKEKNPTLTCLQICSHLFGVDIMKNSVERAKILLSLWALTNGEFLTDDNLNIYEGNSLNYDFYSIPVVNANNGFDVIVGNPPYVRSKNIETNSKTLLKKWKSAGCGNVDLYIPFFEIGMSILNKDGILGYITVNTFFKAVNARNLRDFLTEKKHRMTIVNFGQELIFEKKLAYTCLVFIDSTIGNIHYTKASSKEIKAYNTLKFTELRYDELNSHRGWNLNNNCVRLNIQRIEKIGCTLGDTFIIKNGIATLANDIFIFKPIKSDENYFYCSNGVDEYRIERDICRDIIKPNILKTEKELSIKTEKIIFPYDVNCRIFTEEYFIKQYPYAYKYLCNHKTKLENRDKGNGNYPQWFAFGRTQALTDKGIRLLFPYMSDVPHFVFSEQDDLLMYCGYAIFHESKRELLVLKKILESVVFDYYIKNTSKPYSTNYYAYAKNYVKNFGIYDFNEDEKNEILNLQSKEEIDKYMCIHYGLDLQ